MGATTLTALGLLMVLLPDPRGAAQQPDSGEAYFESLARTASGGFIPAKALYDAYCQECHPDTHARWAESAHKFSSFNNDFYRFSVRETRRPLNGKAVQDARFCAVTTLFLFLSGAFDDPNLMESTAHANHLSVSFNHRGTKPTNRIM